jgi:hypothetical protein
MPTGPEFEQGLPGKSSCSVGGGSGVEDGGGGGGGAG